MKKVNIMLFIVTAFAMYSNDAFSMKKKGSYYQRELTEKEINEWFEAQTQKAMEASSKNKREEDGMIKRVLEESRSYSQCGMCKDNLNQETKIIGACNHSFCFACIDERIYAHYINILRTNNNADFKGNTVEFMQDSLNTILEILINIKKDFPKCIWCNQPIIPFETYQMELDLIKKIEKMISDKKKRRKKRKKKRK